ncbi:MAG TPA: hypothetical protein VKI40_06085, partial [Terriglobales bacterium]|nr:hypothetical protein [Terriglobales bacterium]
FDLAHMGFPEMQELSKLIAVFAHILPQKPEFISVELARVTNDRQRQSMHQIVDVGDDRVNVAAVLTFNYLDALQYNR